MGTERQSHDAVVLGDGSLAFRVKRADGSEQALSIDLLILKLTCQQCEEDHDLQVVNGRINPTPRFLKDLAERLGEFGVTNCTPSLAWQLWLASIEQMEQLKKTTSTTPTLPSGTVSTPAASTGERDLDYWPISDACKPKTPSTEATSMQPITVVSSGYI